MSTNHIKVLSTGDRSNTVTIGPEISSYMLPGISDLSVMDNIISAAVNGKFSDKQPYLWSTGPSDLKVTSLDANLYSSIQNPFIASKVPKNLFTATFPIGTDTGVFRSLALRLNVSVSCASVAQSEFPPSCSGANPLDQTFSNINNSNSMPFRNSSKPRYRTRICAPGDILTSPWQPISDRQDVHVSGWTFNGLAFWTNRMEPAISHSTAMVIAHWDTSSYQITGMGMLQAACWTKCHPTDTIFLTVTGLSPSSQKPRPQIEIIPG